jgi:hypothetical protein
MHFLLLQEWMDHYVVSMLFNKSKLIFLIIYLIEFK